MAISTSQEQISHSIGVVEHETGLGKDTLRMWERRYGFPQPHRDANGERVYPLDQVLKLRLLKGLTDRGYRPGKIIHLGASELQQLLDSQNTAESDRSGTHPDLQAYLDLCAARETDELRRALSQALLRKGMQAFILDVIAPLNQLVGDYWASGTFAVHEEHLYTEVVQNVLRGAITETLRGYETAEARPRILLTTFPAEAHGLGLLMAEAMFALDGARCVSLGLQTPIAEIARAAQAHQADIVALSFSAAINGKLVLNGLRDLRNGLPPGTAIWAGGSCSALPRVPGDVATVMTLNDVPRALSAWRQAGLP
jgi:methanogenic corrinoid protein MtbC1